MVSQTAALDVTADPAGSALTQAYEQVIGRAPTVAELVLGVQQLASGISIGALRAYLATTGYAAAALGNLYNGVVGRAVSAAELTSDQQFLAGGGSLASLRASLATSAEAAKALTAFYPATVERSITAPELAADEAQLAAGGSLNGLRTALAISAEAARGVQAQYAAVLGRAATAAELSSAEAMLASGYGTFSAVRDALAAGSESTGKLTALYGSELGRAITTNELQSDVQLLSYEGYNVSFANIRGYLAGSTEAATALLRTYQANYGTAATPAALAGAEAALAAGASLQAAVAANHAAAPGTTSNSDAVTILQSFQTLFGQPATPADLQAIEAAQAGGTALPAALFAGSTAASAVTADFVKLIGTAPSAVEIAAVGQAYAAGGGILAAVTAVAAASPEFAAAITSAYQAALGRPANAVELAANRSELFLSPPNTEPDDLTSGDLTVSLAALTMQIGNLATTMPSQRSNSPNTPQMVVGTPGLIYGFGNDALIAANPVTVAGNSVTGFNAATDVLQIETRQVPNFAALSLLQIDFGQTQGTRIDLGGGASIFLANVAPSSLSAANFQFAGAVTAVPTVQPTAGQLAQVTAVYADILSRAPTPSELASGARDLAQSSFELGEQRAALGESKEAADDVRALYQSELGRAVTSAELVSDQAALENSSFAQLRTYLATTNEAATAFLAAYQSAYGTPATTASIAAGEQALVGGASLTAAVAANHAATPGAVSNQAASTLIQTYSTVTAVESDIGYGLVGRTESFTDLAASEQALAAGANAYAAAIANPTVTAYTTTLFSALLGTGPSTSELAAIGQTFALDVTASHTAPTQDILPQAITAVAAASPEFASAITTAYEAAYSRPPNEVELAAARSDLSLYDSDFRGYYEYLGRSLTDLQRGIGGGFEIPTVITPETIAGTPGVVYGLSNNVALIAHAPETVVGNVEGGFYDTPKVTGFNPLTDIFQVESREATNFGALNITQAGTGASEYAQLNLKGGVTIDLYGVQKTDLTAANFRFV